MSGRPRCSESEKQAGALVCCAMTDSSCVQFSMWTSDDMRSASCSVVTVSEKVVLMAASGGRCLGPHPDCQALHRHPVREGARVLDVGCGFGDTGLEIARSVGPTGEAVGVDFAESFIVEARSDAQQAGVSNVRFLVRDVERQSLDGPYDRAF